MFFLLKKQFLNDAYCITTANRIRFVRHIKKNRQVPVFWSLTILFAVLLKWSIVCVVSNYQENYPYQQPDNH